MEALDANDLLTMPREFSPTGAETMKVSQVISEFQSRLGTSPEWFTTGIPCSCLILGSSTEWAEGAVRISIEFVPTAAATPPAPAPVPTATTTPAV